MAPVLLIALALAPIEWRELQPGLEYGTLSLTESPSYGDGLLHVVRIDSGRSRIVVRAASALDGEKLTAAQWARREKLAVVINAGMYETDFSTHTGYLRIGNHRNNGAWVNAYQSLFVVKESGAATLLDTRSLPKNHERFEAVVQNLRLIAGPGKNVWTQQPKRWSEAALALDASGRILFLFTRTPFSMHDLNERLLKSGLAIVRAQHLEGGPEASLSVHGGGLDLDLSGSYETGFNENDGSASQWPLPNVIGVVAR